MFEPRPLGLELEGYAHLPRNLICREVRDLVHEAGPEITETIKRVVTQKSGGTRMASMRARSPRLAPLPPTTATGVLSTSRRPRAPAAAASKADGEADVLAKIAEMTDADRVMAEGLHAVVKASAPQLAPKTWSSRRTSPRSCSAP